MSYLRTIVFSVLILTITQSYRNVFLSARLRLLEFRRLPVDHEALPDQAVRHVLASVADASPPPPATRHATPHSTPHATPHTTRPARRHQRGGVESGQGVQHRGRGDEDVAQRDGPGGRAHRGCRGRDGRDEEDGPQADEEGEARRSSSPSSLSSTDTVDGP